MTCVAASALKSDERVVFFPSLGWRTAAGWEAEVHGCVYKPESRPLTASALHQVLGIDEDDLRPEERARLRDRMRLFLADNERGKRVQVAIEGQTHTVGRSQANGHFRGTVTLPAALRPGTVPFRMPPEAGGFSGVIHLLEPSGLSVISDIDDTIKLSQVRDRQELVRNTFCRPFHPVPGLAAVYQSWAEAHGARFHYLSASPWQLYPPLAEFVGTNGFPAATFHLRDFRLKDGTFLDLLKSPAEHKTGVIEVLLKRFPQRRFLLVGDSGEQDPEIYAALARAHRSQVQRILIRDVTGEPAGAARYQQAFAGLPGSVWRVFREPLEIGESAR